MRKMRICDLPERMRAQVAARIAPLGPKTPAVASEWLGGTFSRHEAQTRQEAPRRAYSGTPNRTEARYDREALGGKGRYEAVTLRLPGGSRYTPDWMTVDDGVVTFHEVKGDYRLPSQGRALTAFREAAAAFPMWRFVWATLERSGRWRVERLDPQW